MPDLPATFDYKICQLATLSRHANVHLWGREARVAAALEVVRLRQRGSPVQQDLEDLVVVVVRRQDERGDVRGVAGGHGVDRFPEKKNVEKQYF